MPDMPGRGTPKFSVRLPEEVRKAALQAAEEKGEVLSEEVRWFIETYPERKPRRRRKSAKRR